MISPTDKPDPEQSHVVSDWTHDRPLIACRFDPTGKFVFCGAEDNGITRFRLSDGEKTVLPDGHRTWVKAFAFSADGNTMISGGYDGQLAWWNVAPDVPVLVRTMAAHGTQWIRGLESSPDSTTVVSCGNDNHVRQWTIDDGNLVREFGPHEKHVYSVAFDAEGTRLFSGDLGGSIREWDTASGKLTRTLEAKDLWSFNTGQKVDFGGVRSLSCSPDGKWIAAGGLHKATNPLGAIHEPLILLIDRETGEVTKKLVAEGIKRGVVWRVRWLADGIMMAVCGGGDGGYLLFWNMDADKDFFRLKLPNIARDMDLHQDGQRIATAHHDKKLRITLMAKKEA